MWNSLLKNKDNNSLLKNRYFRNYLFQSQLNSIKNIVDHRLDQNKLDRIKYYKKEDNDLILKEYLDKINNFSNDKLENNSINLKKNELSTIKHMLSFKTHLLLFALTSFTTTIGYLFYLQFKK